MNEAKVNIQIQGAGRGCSDMMSPSVKQYYENVKESNGADNQEDSTNDRTWNGMYEVSLAPPSMQHSSTTKISKDAGPSFSRPNTLLYESIDFFEGTIADNKVAEPVIGYQELIREAINPPSQYKCLELPGNTGELDDWIDSHR